MSALEVLVEPVFALQAPACFFLIHAACHLDASVPGAQTAGARKAALRWKGHLAMRSDLVHAVRRLDAVAPKAHRSALKVP